LLAIVITAAVAILQTGWPPKMTGTGDTDDAMRLVLVRDLLHGRGWYDQWIGRLQPPQGIYLHWSRLLDGAIAGLIGLFRQVAPSAEAEWRARYVWPLIWIAPAVAAALFLARNLGGRAAVFLTAPLLLVDVQLYRQFTPGRIDHHNIQIVMATIAAACVTARRNRTAWAAVGGAAAALGLAIGLEALPMQAIIGAAYALRLAKDRTQAGPARAYGLALALGGAALFLIQTPPWRWSLSACDALALNLVLGLGVGGLGLAFVAGWTRRSSERSRTLWLLAVGASALIAYLAPAPQCLHGPFAEMNPAVKSFWFDRVQEVQPIWVMLRLQHQAAVVALAMMVAAVAAGAYLLGRSSLERAWPGAAPLTLAALLAVSVLIAIYNWRMQDYVFWLGLPALGAAVSVYGARHLENALIPSLVVVLALSPRALGEGWAEVEKKAAPPTHAPASPGPRCFAASAYRALAALPKGVVFSETDLGPFILRYTPHSAVSAPYHRMSDAILAVHQAFSAPPAEAEARVRALGADYVVDCPPYTMSVSVQGFGTDLRSKPPPPWLTRLSPPGAVLQIYRLNPPAAARSPA
jgi:hypothetical protein